MDSCHARAMAPRTQLRAHTTSYVGMTHTFPCTSHGQASLPQMGCTIHTITRHHLLYQLTISNAPIIMANAISFAYISYMLLPSFRLPHNVCQEQPQNNVEYISHAIYLLSPFLGHQIQIPRGHSGMNAIQARVKRNKPIIGKIES